MSYSLLGLSSQQNQLLPGNMSLLGLENPTFSQQASKVLHSAELMPP